jgi:hypothetical protein
VTGAETDTFSRAPAPTTLEIDAVDSVGNSTMLKTAALPVDTIDLGNQDANAVASLHISGFDGSGKVVVFGASLPLQYGALEGVTLNIFVQRTGELARMPSSAGDAREAPTVATIVDRYIFVGGGGDANLAKSTELYDLATYAPLSSPPSLPRAPLSISLLNTTGLIIDADGATTYDFSTSTSTDAQAPSGASYAEIAGGATFTASDKSSYVVGATRTTGAPTDKVLAIDSSGNVAVWTLSAPRLGAAAAWVEGQGLIVAGGSATAAGVEIVPPKSDGGKILPSNGTPLPFPSDATAGAGATVLDATRVLVAGGVDAKGADAGVRVLDVACRASCAAQAWTAPLATALPTAQAFRVDGMSAFVVGNDASGATHSYRVTSAAATEVPLKVARKNARAILLPTGAVVIVGGATAIESFVP